MTRILCLAFVGLLNAYVFAQSSPTADIDKMMQEMLHLSAEQRAQLAIDQTCHRHRETRGKGVHAMSKKPKEIDFRREAEDQLNAIRSRIGQEVPLSNRYVRGQRAILVSVDGETATLQFPNGATLAKVPLRDLVDDSGYWKP